MSQNLKKVANFQKIQLDHLVDFEKCCKTRIFLQKSVPIQPKTSNILPKFCQKLATTQLPYGSLRRRGRARGSRGRGRRRRALGLPVRPARMGCIKKIY